MCCMEPLRLMFYSMLFKNKMSKQYKSLNLPLKTNLVDGTPVIVRLMTDQQLSETYRLIDEASKLGQGFGVNEYVSEEDFRLDVKDSHKFVITRQSDGENLAFFILAVSRYSRGVNVADPYIIVNPVERGRRIGNLCLELCETFAKALGFLGLYVDMFTTNTAMIRMVDHRGGYRRVGTLPAGGVMTDGSIVSSVVYYKDLREGIEEDVLGDQEEVLRHMATGRRARRRSMW